MGRSYLPEDWIRDANVTPQTRCLAALLSSYADAEHGDQDVWPSPETLAKALGMSKRNITRLGDEGQAAGWWTRIYQRNFRGGVELTWRLHFPTFSANGHRSDTEATPMSLGRNDSGNTNGAQQTPNGQRTDTEATPMSAGRYEGTTVRRDEGDGSLTLTPPAPKKPTKASRRRKAQTDDEMHEAADKCPSEQDAVAYAIEKGLAPSEKWWAEAWWIRWEERRWIATDKAGNRSPVGNWKLKLTTAFKYAVADRPSLKGRQDANHTPTIDGQIDPWGKR